MCGLGANSFKLNVLADVSGIEELHRALLNGAEGIGILRTEHLFCNSKGGCSEEEQYRYYSEAVKAAGDRGITVRTFDGGPNLPMLGDWGIRYSINHPEIFRTQLRALLRSAVYGKMSIVFPGVADIEHFKWAKEQFNAVKEQLEAEGLKFNHIPLGIMIEIPAAVINFSILVHDINFFIVDSDRLLPLLMGADDNCSEVILKDPLHPAMLWALKNIMLTKQRNQLNVSVCGELAALPYAIPLFKGLGIRNTIVKAKNITKLSNLAKNLDDENALRIASKTLALSNAQRIKSYVSEALTKLKLMN